MRPKTCYWQQQSSQYPIFPSQAWDQSLTRVARNETKYQEILDAADFARRENCAFIRLNDASRKTLSRQPKKSKKTHYDSRVQSNTRWFQTDIQRELWEVMKNILLGNRLIAGEKLIKVSLLWAIRQRLKKKSNCEKHAPLQGSVREISVAMFLQIQTNITKYLL